MNLYERELNPNPDIVFTVVDEEAILLDQKTGKYYSLNRVGTRLWDLVMEYKRLDKAYERMSDEFEVEEMQLRADLEGMVTQFIETGLLL
jgi:hypothetical protein